MELENLPARVLGGFSLANRVEAVVRGELELALAEAEAQGAEDERRGLPLSHEKAKVAASVGRATAGEHVRHDRVRVDWLLDSLEGEVFRARCCFAMLQGRTRVSSRTCPSSFRTGSTGAF